MQKKEEEEKERLGNCVVRLTDSHCSQVSTAQCKTNISGSLITTHIHRTERPSLAAANQRAPAKEPTSTLERFFMDFLGGLMFSFPSWKHLAIV